ncbi:hypothetical protein [Bradyrhizobium australiense]|uniref:Uncharacterized protein n=1 Tax=Bradyrhizobium australiense TaxID=2721161 RepID=A0A7Y4LYS9_9BRAD|nr:hypothetical protein [Bradyrhizobium australiense]NOJ43907.1 hypothetical protein [Bradyrhizobium australiense]
MIPIGSLERSHITAISALASGDELTTSTRVQAGRNSWFTTFQPERIWCWIVESNAIGPIPRADIEHPAQAERYHCLRKRYTSRIVP